MKKLVKHAIQDFFEFRKILSSGNFLVKHANWQFFEIQKFSAFGHNFLKSAKCPHQVIFPNLKNFLIRHFSNSTGNFAQIQKIASLGNLLKSETCPHKKIIPNLTNFPTDHFFQQYALT